MAVLLLLCIAWCPKSAGAADPGIVTFDLRNYGRHEHELVATFGAVFVRGDVPRGVALEAFSNDGKNMPLQVDLKATHADRSLRHAVVTVAIPDFPAGTAMPITLRKATQPTAAKPRITLADLPTNFDATVTLVAKTGRLTISARKLLAHGRVDSWLAGPLVSEWWVAGPFTDQYGHADPHMQAMFGIRCYGKNRPLRIEVDVENAWTYVAHPRTEFYDAQITLGGKIVFSKANMIQPSHTRWRQEFWWNDPVAIYVRQDLEYLKKTRVIPNYEPDLQVSRAAIDEMYRAFQESAREPMAAGILTKYMPTSGGRPDIAPLPQWQALYLLSMDPKMYEVTLQTADLGASFSSHYRNEKTGRPVTLQDYPEISTHSNLVGRPGQLELRDTGGYSDPLVPDAAHEPALDFVPYLVTGDRFYLDELQFWSQWNETGTAPGYRGFGKALVNWDQVRAQAWSLRTLAQAEFITPDDDPLKRVLTRELQENVAWYNADFLRGPDTNRLGLLWQPRSAPDTGRLVAPWQDDFFTWTIGYIGSLGDVDVQKFLRWKSSFVVGRMIAPGFCWILAPSYTMTVRDSIRSDLYPAFENVYWATLADRLGNKIAPARKTECASKEMADLLGLGSAGEMVENSSGTDGYSAFMQPALAAAVDAGAPSAVEAWRLFSSRRIKPNYAVEPGWDIMPRSPAGRLDPPFRAAISASPSVAK